MDWVIWREAYDERAAQVSGPLGVERGYEILDGTSRAAEWPETASFEVMTRHPKATKLRDNKVSVRYVIVSTRLRDAIAELGVPNLELLRISITRPAKGKKAAEVTPGYFILHPVGTHDCLDEAASEPTYSDEDKREIAWLSRLVLDPVRLEGAPPIFRVGRVPWIILTERGVAERLMAGGFDGLQFAELSQYEA